MNKLGSCSEFIGFEIKNDISEHGWGKNILIWSIIKGVRILCVSEY